MKRAREQQHPPHALDLAISLSLLPPPITPHSMEFECKTCNRKFSSFQALGGHRASHKKPRLDSQAQPHKPDPARSVHECSICGQRFSLGQALGGHMRKHRAAVTEEAVPCLPVLRRCNSKRVVCLDLNLTPLQNDLNLLFGDRAPQLNLSLCS
ncbi:zinc finger protein ZAT11-like [Prosopis cineraria]|uniref:zinc finger protein ZAT11-like n=1 Tax=Prosopis cineraria TaxID=364024 RepID=UPI00240EB5BF|nr:zinc finger protein ZAT11-like [Prosopis cineraria]